MDTIILVHILEIIGGVLVGAFLHWILLSSKISKLQNTVENLTGIITRLEARIESVDTLRRELFQLEIRMSDSESEIKRLDKEIDFNRQSIKE